MNQLSRNNLKEFCRTCLKSLQKRRERDRQTTPTNKEWLNAEEIDTDIGFESIRSYNLSLLPQLRKLFVLITSLEVSEEDDEDAYPRSLCQLCYEKMMGFQEFRNLAINSAEVLYKIVNSLDDGMIGAAAQIPKLQGNENDLETKSNSPNLCRSYQSKDDDDDQLLLPELASLMEKPIKREPLDYNNSNNLSSEIIMPNDDMSENSSIAIIKNEIDSEYEEENLLFYENNALGTNFNSISDDADGEGNAYRYGPANMSSALLNNIAVGGKQRVCGPSRRRDRNKKSLKCPRCDKQVYKQVYLDAHIRAIHEGHDKPFLCLECQKAFTRYDQLHTHVQSQHLLEQKFICGLNGCDAVFKLSNTLETHRQVVHTSSFRCGLQELLELHQAQLNHEGEMDHICQQCFKKYSSKRALSDHLKRHAQIKDHICKTCGVAKVTRTELQTHMRTHKTDLEKFKCSICPQEFNHKNAIARHVRVVHEGQRRFPCTYCPKRFATRNSQVCHERLHTGERPFNCELCNKRYAQVEGLKSHMKSHDKTLRKHVCSFCSQRFITRKNLIDHEKRHKSEKPHICNACSRGFFSIEDLSVHKKSHTEKQLRGELEQSDYEAYQVSGDSIRDQAMHAGSLHERGDEAFSGYSSSQSSN